MNWLHLKLCLFALIYFTSYSVNAENDDQKSLHHNEEELIPSEQIIDSNDAVTSGKKESLKQTDTHGRQTLLPNLSGRNLGCNFGFPLGHGIVPNNYVGQPLDAQASSPTSNVVLVLGDEKNKLAELVKPVEESITRLTRNPGTFDDMVQQMNQFRGNFVQQMMQQVAQTAPEMTRTFGQALSEALAQTSLLAQTPPGNLNLTQSAPTPPPPPPPPPGNFDFGRLVGATQNLFNPQATQNTPEANTATGANAREAQANSNFDQDTEPQVGLQNSFDSIVGKPLLPSFNFGIPPLGLLSPFKLFNPLLPLASEVSEVRVRPDNYNPYKLTPKEVDQHQTMTEMKLKAMLSDALSKKTIPILWFHLPSDDNIQKSADDLETETKLKIFEKQVVAELKQLQELSKLANGMKRALLQSGAQPTTSLTTTLNLSEIPIYDITLGDIEKTLKDEHMLMLMHTIVQNQNKEYQRHHQASTKYLTDLTGTPIKRQVTAEDAQKAMEKDDMLKMMTYAYRKQWLGDKERQMGMGGENPSKSNDGNLWNNNEQNTFMRQWADPNMPTKMLEKQWIEDKQRQVTKEAEMQSKIPDSQQNAFMRKWADPNMPPKMQSMMDNTEQMAEKQWTEDKQRQMTMEAGEQRKIGNSQQNNFMRQWAGPNMHQKMESMMENTEKIAEDKPRQITKEAEKQSKIPDSQQNTSIRQWDDPNMPPKMQSMMDNAEKMAQNQWSEDKQRQMATEAEKQKKIVDCQQNIFTRQWVDHNNQPMMSNTKMTAEKQWLEDKQRQMAMEAEMQRKVDNTQQWLDPNMPIQVQPMMSNTQMTAEKQWLEDKQRQMAMEAETQRKLDNTQQWLDPNMPIKVQPMMSSTHMTAEMQWLEDKQRQMAMEAEKQKKAFNAQQNAFTRQWVDHNMPTQMFMQRQMINPNMQQQQQQEMQMMYQQNMEVINMQPQMQRQWSDTNMPNAMMPQPVQHQWLEPNMQQPQTQPIQRQWADPNMAQTTATANSEAPSSLKASDQDQMLEPKAREINKETVAENLTEQKNAELITADFKTTKQITEQEKLIEAKPQTAESADKARLKGLQDVLDDLNIFDKDKDRHKHIKPNTVNYYYNNGGSQYPPTYSSPGGYQVPTRPLLPPRPYYSPAPGGYGKPPQYPVYYPVVPKYKPSANLYGGGGYGSNAYGSYGGFRAAVGDEEIAAMLQQQQQQMPKIIMPNDNDPMLFTINTTAIEHDQRNVNTNTPTQIPLIRERLARNGNESIYSPAAYLLVVRNHNKNSKSKKSRSKRSMEYATLEPIDENSLNVLRKTYKNSLKEITLKPNETPEEALRRYNADSIREALEKANQQPMEIDADTEHQHESVKDGKEIEQQQRSITATMVSQLGNDLRIANSAKTAPTGSFFPREELPVTAGIAQQQQLNQNVPMAYVLNDNGQFEAMQAPATPLPIQQSYSQLPEVIYQHYQEDLDNNYVTKYNNNPYVYDIKSKILPENPYSSLYNSLELVPLEHDYSSVPNQRYQVAYPNKLNSIPKTSKRLYYQKSLVQPLQLDSSDKTSNDIATNLEHIYSPLGHARDYNISPKDTLYANYPEELAHNKGPYLFTNTVSKHQPKPSQKELRGNRFKTQPTLERVSFENIMSVIKERLTQCCDDCKTKILKSLDEIFQLKQNHNNNAFLNERQHVLKYRQPAKEDDVEYQQWLREMSEKGYDKNYLTKQHQSEYLNEGKLNLHIMAEDGYGQEDDKVFYKNNQSYKRETAESDLVMEKKVTASLEINNNMEKLIDKEKEDEEEATMQHEALPQEKEELKKEFNYKSEQKGIKVNPSKTEESSSLLNKEQNKLTTQKPTQTLKNKIKPMETSETTTHSVYAMRGQFRPQKLRSKPFTLTHQAKHFGTYRNINKIGNANANAIAKVENQNDRNNIEKNNKLEEILDLLHDISKHTKEHKKENNSTTANKLSKNTATDAINNANLSEKVAHKKSRVPLKERKSSKNSSESKDLNMESSKSIG